MSKHIEKVRIRNAPDSKERTEVLRALRDYVKEGWPVNVVRAIMRGVNPELATVIHLRDRSQKKLPL